ncbi:MAG TPA: hypothetical protein PKC15_07750 [Rhodocyclaceae bacterium]|uniref:hypothetical protein n=1 Tax=Plasticicumulans sp. TaxID=2307179 RepID=UPI002BE1FF68|nr:hypothetical protein [Rhodocyclaceae bacterium]
MIASTSAMLAKRAATNLLRRISSRVSACGRIGVLLFIAHLFSAERTITGNDQAWLFAFIVVGFYCPDDCHLRAKQQNFNFRIDAFFG